MSPQVFSKGVSTPISRLLGTAVQAVGGGGCGYEKVMMTMMMMIAKCNAMMINVAVLPG